jgi:hypothetical protein
MRLGNWVLMFYDVHLKFLTDHWAFRRRGGLKKHWSILKKMSAAAKKFINRFEF